MPDFSRDYDKEPVGARLSDLWMLFFYGILTGIAGTLGVQWLL